ncbi:putative RNA methyltransferase [Streptantibioticus parmotrematis]|uniref:putative RNA methyltransferase n=1 Tax=Streptantibioticus parmotrematis TaxID=2873249 RepID=UPI0033D27638
MSPDVPDAFGLLVCPVCGDGLARRTGGLGCPAGHSFDLARQGYVNLLTGNARSGTADTPEMVAARSAFLTAGHYAPLTEAVARAAVQDAPGTVLDAGTGTGHYLAAVLDALPGARGLGLDISKFALRRAARAHPRARAAVWDVWRPLPVRTGAVDLVLNVFAPRNAAEFHRVLRPGGTLLVVTPGPDHLAELRAGMLDVDADKDERLDRALSGHFRQAERVALEYPMTLTPAEAADAVGMGPSAHHAERRAGALPEEPVRVTASFRLSRYRPA